MATAEYSLKRVVWQKIKKLVLDDCMEEEWKILILDHYTTKLLSSCCKVSTLMAEKISVVEDLHKNREPVPDMKAIYFITPTEKSVDALINDFKKKHKYKAAYVYFTDYCPDNLFSQLKTTCSKPIKRCKEVNVSFLSYESQVFIFDIPDAFYSIYSPASKDKNTIMEMMAEKIATVCATLDENPGVRYRKERGNDYSFTENNAEYLAHLVEEKLAEHYKLAEDSNIKGKTQSQLLIIDRGFDPVSTILHELTFQAMAYDLIPIENNIYRYQIKDESTSKEALLDEDDTLWINLRHLHIAEVGEKIPKLVKELTQSSKATEGKLTVSSLSQMMKKLPAFRKQKAKQTVHLTLAEDCMKRFHGIVEKLCKAEQDLAVGTDAQSQKIKDPMRIILPFLLDKSIGDYDKLRIILLYIFHVNGTTEENLGKLIQHGRVAENRDIIENWKFLDVPILSSNSQQRKPVRKDRSAEESYQLSRWTPFIKDIMEDSIANKLDSLDWPHCSGCSAAWNGSGAVSARQGNKSNLPDDRRGGLKLIIFVIGGMTYSEMRCAYEVSKASKFCEVIIGSTHILTPTGLLDDLKKLNK
ncbi:syntaxin-binding protein 3 [Pristis pectinata]|uniref:syntaxin-binding protein 3 n=1 Tax=Pristis pectinata TaxID=685728 RepID=UPI00223D33DF|nr:syntaxin-binding protein 3 [Pristis pectinata]